MVLSEALLEPALLEIPFPSAGISTLDIAGIRGAGEIEDAVSRHGINRLCDSAILKWGFGEIANIVDDDPTTACSEVADILGHLRLTTKAGGV